MNKKASYFSYPSYFVNPNSKKAPSNSIQVTDSVRGSLKNMHEKEKKQNYIGGAGFGAIGGLVSGLNLHEQKKTDLLFQNLGNPGAIKNPKMWPTLLTGAVIGAGVGAGLTGVNRWGRNRTIENAESITPFPSLFSDKKEQRKKLEKDLKDNMPKTASSGHEMIWYEKRSTPEVIPVGTKPKAKPSYGPITKRRRATADEEKEIATGKWIRIDERGNRPSSDSYKKTKYRPQLVKEKTASTGDGSASIVGGTALSLLGTKAFYDASVIDNDFYNWSQNVSDAAKSNKGTNQIDAVFDEYVKGGKNISNKKFLGVKRGKILNKTVEAVNSGKFPFLKNDASLAGDASHYKKYISLGENDLKNYAVSKALKNHFKGEFTDSAKKIIETPNLSITQKVNRLEQGGMSDAAKHLNISTGKFGGEMLSIPNKYKKTLQPHIARLQKGAVGVSLLGGVLSGVGAIKNVNSRKKEASLKKIVKSTGEVLSGSRIRSAKREAKELIESAKDRKIQVKNSRTKTPRGVGNDPAYQKEWRRAILDFGLKDLKRARAASDKMGEEMKNTMKAYTALTGAGILGSSVYSNSKSKV